MSTAAKTSSPINRGGIVVRSIREGNIGITTDAPRKTTPTIGVQFVGMAYPILCQIAELELVTPDPADVAYGLDA